MTKPRRSMRRTVRMTSVVLTLMVMPLLLTACGSFGTGAKSSSSTTVDPTETTFAANSTMGTIRSRGHLIVGVRWNNAPFSYLDPSTGSPSGFDVDLAKAVAKTIFGSANIEGKITWVPLDPRENELALEQNKVDMVVGRYQVTVAKKQFVDFAGPYFSDPQSILVDNHVSINTRISSIADLNGRKVCVVTGSTDVGSFQALAPAADVSDVKTTVSQCGADLVGGVVSAVVASHIDELSFLNTSTDISPLGQGYAPALYGIGVKKGTDDLRSFLNNQIEAFDWSKTYSADIGTDASAPDQPSVDRY